ncbi:MAG: hypothetical protein MUE79_09415 [Nitratireductor sp.]|nr:hypothetical protein [Nitratireductor sp.]
MIALFTALLAPFFVDWTSHRAAFEAEASRIIGQPVKVSGEAGMRILPLPSVTFAEISVGQYEDGTPMMTAASFTMDAELMPFLRGELKIVDMRLERPHALIRVNENGVVAWTQRKEALVEHVKVKLERCFRPIPGGCRRTGRSASASNHGGSTSHTVSHWTARWRCATACLRGTEPSPSRPLPARTASPSPGPCR